MSQQPIEIVEVSPRDGLQNEATAFSTEDKVALIEGCLSAGLRRIEVCSFVNPKRVPQMADAEAVLAHLRPEAFDGAIGLVLNERGLDRALATPLEEINYVVVVTETFSQKNQGMSVEANLSVARAVTRRAKEAGLRTSITISAAFGCPYEGEVSVDQLYKVIRQVADMEPFEIAIADTIGVAVPRDVHERITGAQQIIDGRPIKLRCHFHNTRNTGLANAMAAVEEGITTLDASLGGIGGCPFAPNATGNIPTEDLAYMLDRSGYELNLNLAALFPVVDLLSHKLPKPVPGLLTRAGLFPPPA
ncbi:MAG: hydroxymethylglutaryl-CoA lyase [Ferrimicrobium sp.]|uniref:Hydroxymethylglutaryl-CoA lyase n=1 Tax=Ferrimicrobium acidiphilum TaxID=121039 RepID=A0ABV3Y331_9ACTN|nr:hydroxymethylglutaryl-CoA lyase [Ferrimicrobium sp.]MCL5052751.1 hydroxymethylglutaryl-CoA lyase [Gammaproteobacteria bacterium]